MTKLRTPLLGLEASGSLGDTLTFQERGRISFVRKKPRPLQPNSLAQMYHRWFYQDYCYLWSDLSQADKQTWIDLARGTRLSGFQLYIKTKLLTLPELAGLWHFDSQSGGATKDSSPFNQFTVVWGCQTSPGIIHNSFHFDGLNDYCQCSDAPQYHFTASMTVETWIHSTLDDSTWRTYVAKWNTATANKRTFSLAQSNTNEIDLRFKGTAVTVCNAPVILNRWVHIAGVYDHPLSLLYVDGVLADSVNNPIAPLEINNEVISFGEQKSFRRWFQGYQDHVFLWNIPLPPELIKVHSERRWP